MIDPDMLDGDWDDEEERVSPIVVVALIILIAVLTMAIYGGMS